MARRNLSTNPSLETNTTGHAVVFTRAGITVGAVSRSNTIAAQAGTYYGFVNVTGTTAGTTSDFDLGFPTATVVAGQQYTASVYLRHTVTGPTANLVIEWRTSGGALIGSESQGGYNAVSSTAWGRHTVTATAPAAATQARAVVWVDGVTDTTSRSFRWDAHLFEQAATAGSYFDGDTSTATWDGTAHASTSTIPDPVTVADRPTRVGARRTVDTVTAGTSTTYYVSPTGNNANNGTSTATPWQTIAKVNSTTFAAGDSVLFQGGQTFTGTQLYLDSTKAGTAAAPVTFGSYGTGRATIANTTNAAIFLYNVGGIVIRDLILTTAATLDVVSLYKDTAGRSNYIRIDNVDCSLGKIGLAIGGENGGGFSDVQVTNSVLRNNRDQGMVTYGSAYNPAAPAWANSNITVSGCTAHTNLGNPANTTSNTGSGIVLGSVDVGLVELCIAYGNGGSHGATGEGPVGIWCYDARNVTIRRSTSYNNNTGTTADGGGFDIDINSTGCVVERCVAYGNEGPGILVFGTTANTAHTGNVVRDCLLWGNTGGTSTYYGEIKVVGNVDQLNVYSNTVVANGARAVVDLDVDATGLARFRNNVFVARGTGPVVRTRSVAGITEALFQGNAYHQAGTGALIDWNTVTYSSLAAWRAAVTGQEVVGAGNTGYVGDPGLAAPATSPAVTDPAVLTPANGLKLSTGSAVATTGLDLVTTFGMTVGLDYFGGTRTSPFSVGAHEQDALAVTLADPTRGAVRARDVPSVVPVVVADSPTAVRAAGAVDTAVAGGAGDVTATDLTRGAVRARDTRDPVPVTVADTPTAVRGVGAVDTVTGGGPVAVADTPTAVRAVGTVETAVAARHRVPALDVAVRDLAPRWELLVAETRTGTVLAELPFTDLTWNTPINDIGTLTATIPIEAHVEWLADDRSPINRLRTVLSGEWRFSLCAVFGNAPIIAGPLITSTPVTGDANVTVGCAELGALLKRRRVRTPGTDPAGLGADLALGPASLPQLARLLLEKATDPANGGGWDLPLILPDLVTKGDHVRNYLASDLADYWTRLSDLAEVQDGPDVRFEPELTDVVGGRKLWWRVRIGQPWLGTWVDGENPPRPPWVFDLGAGLRDLTTDRDASAMTMRTYVPGQARTEAAATESSLDTTAPQDTAKPIGSAQDLALIAAGYPVLEDVDGSHTSATEQRTLDAWAVAGVAVNKAPIEAWNVTVDGASSPRLGQWRVGDTATFVVAGQHLVEDGEHERRIVGASGDAGTDVTLVLTPVPAAV